MFLACRFLTNHTIYCIQEWSARAPAAVRLATWKQAQDKSKRDRQVDGSALAALIMTVENHLLEECAAELEARGLVVMDLVYDGLHAGQPPQSAAGGQDEGGASAHRQASPHPQGG